ncbi:MAG: hypothetical protein ISS78_03565 [Phycisphaerae bacterium]|nr:hypothetical protein [Phycisphaerae bacterium]
MWIGTAIYVLVLYQRKNSQRIRMWASENGYAVIRLQYRYALGAFGTVLTILFLGLLKWGSWFVELQDEQGGIRRGYVHFPVRYLPPWFDVPWGKMDIEWR